MDDKQCIAEVSDAVMQLDQSRTVRLGSGRRLEVSRLNWLFDDVLLIAAALVELNFVETAGVRSFFTALGRLAPPVDSPR